MAEQSGAVRELVSRARQRQMRVMIDTVTVTHHTTPTFSDLTGQYDDPGTVVYTGPARIKRAMAEDQVTGDRERQVATDILVLPYGVSGSGDLQVSDTVYVDQSVDAELQGKTLTVLGPEHGTTTSAHRYRLEEVSG